MTESWMVVLNGVGVSYCATQAEWDARACFPLTVLDALTDTPDGLGLPGLRTEDVTYFQRDGVKHFSDWYTHRTITLTGQLGPATTDECVDGDCLTIREQLNELVQAWKRACCDTELVIYPPCDVPHTEENAYPPEPCVDEAQNCTEVAQNLSNNPSAEFTGGWRNALGGDYTLTWDTSQAYVGDRSRKVEKVSGSSPILAFIDSVGDTTDGAVVPVTAGDTITASVWVRASAAGYQGRMQFAWDVSSSDDGPDIPLTAGVWTRVSATIVVPPGNSGVNIQALVATPSPFPDATLGDYANFDASMVTEGPLVDYFDGDTEPAWDEENTAWAVFSWAGDPNESESIKSLQAAKFRGTITSGPYGVIGRPRVMQYKWVNRSEQIADFVLRFDAVDQRMYLLDECGTPGTTDCVNINPGAQLSQLCVTGGELCLTGGQLCVTDTVEGASSVEPTEVGVGGTELVFPTITLFGPLIRPYVENITTGEWVQLDTTIPVDGYPVTINTEDGTAFDSEGNSLTHLLRGSLFLSMAPGNYEWRLLSNGLDVEDPGYSSLCWRNTVVNA